MADGEKCYKPKNQSNMSWDEAVKICREGKEGDLFNIVSSMDGRNAMIHLGEKPAWVGEAENLALSQWSE